MTLIEHRYPTLGPLLRLWRSHCRGDAPPCASALATETLAGLAASTVLLARSDNGAEQLTIAASGAEVDTLYGESLAGSAAARLAPARGDAEQEALSAIKTARPVVIEDEFRAGGRRRRVARLYLPLANDDGSANGVLCGVVALS